MPQLRLIGVTVLPHFVLDDGETLTPVDQAAVTIPAAEWPTYSSERFPAEAAKWQADIDAGNLPPAPASPTPPAPPTPPPNRAARRAKPKR